MKKFISNKRAHKFAAIYLTVAVLFMNFPITAFAAPVLTVDLKANNQDSLVLASASDSFNISVSSTNATACQQSAPVVSGIATNTTMPVTPADVNFYPTLSSSVTFTVTCTDGTDNVSDSVTVSLAAVTLAAVPTIDIKANGSDGPLTINQGDSYTLAWTSTNATACQQTSPVASGISLSGTSSAVVPGSVYYPSVGSPITITVVCTNGSTNATDSVVINLAGPIVATSTPSVPTIDIKANGSDGPITINQGDSYTFTWVSTNATACQQTSPVASGISLSGTSSAVIPGSPYYPTTGSPITITVVCTNGSTNATDSVVINLARPIVPGGGGTVPTVDVKANGSDGPITINQGDSYTFTWVSTNATACQQTSPVASGISLSGTSSAVVPGSVYYPSIGAPITITVVCTNGTTNATDSVVINLASTTTPPVTPPGGGGGSSSGGGGSSNGGGHHHGGDLSCLYVKDYMRMDFNNDPSEVIKLQAFLKVIMGYDYVNVNGVYDQTTFNAVSQFQMTYKDDILTPWGHTAPTGYTYILTLKKINEIYCQHLMPISEAQAHEISAFRALIQGLRDKGYAVESRTVTIPGHTTVVPVTTISTSTESTSTPIEIPVVGQIIHKGQNIRNLAAAVFSIPNDIKGFMQCLYEWLLILIVLYILGSVLKDVLYKDLPENVLKRFLTKWITISVGLAIAIIIAYILEEWCIILPLLIALIISLIWMAIFPKHGRVKNYTTVIVDRSKSIFKKRDDNNTIFEVK